MKRVEYAEANTKTKHPAKVVVAIVKDANGKFNPIKVVTQVKSGDHTIFVGEVKHAWLDEEKEVITVKDLM